MSIPHLPYPFPLIVSEYMTILSLTLNFVSKKSFKNKQRQKKIWFVFSITSVCKKVKTQLRKPNSYIKSIWAWVFHLPVYFSAFLLGIVNIFILFAYEKKTWFSFLFQFFNPSDFSLGSWIIQKKIGTEIFISSHFLHLVSKQTRLISF